MSTFLTVLATTLFLATATAFAVAVARLRRTRAALRAALRDAATDELTGLPNRRSFRTRLAERLGVGGPFSVALIDLDQFKQVNDRCGHDAGDQLLRGVAERLAVLPEPVEFAARLQGDEFVLLIDGERETAMAAAHAAWRAIIAPALPVWPRGTPAVTVPVAASIGVAAWRLGQSGAELLQQADVAMYAAKAAGGDTVHAYTPTNGDTLVPHRPTYRHRDRRHHP